MTRPLAEVLAEVRTHLLDTDQLVRAVASGRQKATQPRWRRVELRYVDLKAGRHLQVTAYDATQAHTTNHPVVGEPTAAAAAIDALLAETFGNWHVETTTQTHQVRVTKRLEAVLSTTDRAEPVDAVRGHDRDKSRLLPEGDPVFKALGLTDQSGRMKPSRQAKYRQVEEFLRILDSTLTEAIDKGQLRRPTEAEPLRVVDLGCGNAYLTFTAHRFLTSVRGWPVAMTGVDVREQSREHNSGVAAGLGIGEDSLDFVVGGISTVALAAAPEVVLALHACDTATDDALSRAIEWKSTRGPGGPVLPPRRRRPAAQDRHPVAVRRAHPPRHPARALRRHPDRRRALAAAAARGLSRRRDGVRRQRAHAAQQPAASRADGATRHH